MASSWSASRIGAQSEPTNQTRHPTAPGFGCHPLANHRPRPDAFRHQIVSEWVCWIGQSGAAPCDDRVSGSASVLWQPVDWEGEEHAVCEERNGRAQGGREHPAKQQQQAEGRKEGRKGALSPPLLGLCLTPPPLTLKPPPMAASSPFACQSSVECDCSNCLEVLLPRIQILVHFNFSTLYGSTKVLQHGLET